MVNIASLPFHFAGTFPQSNGAARVASLSACSGTADVAQVFFPRSLPFSLARTSRPLRLAEPTTEVFLCCNNSHGSCSIKNVTHVILTSVMYALLHITLHKFLQQINMSVYLVSFKQTSQKLADVAELKHIWTSTITWCCH